MRFAIVLAALIIGDSQGQVIPKESVHALAVMVGFLALADVLELFK